MAFWIRGSLLSLSKSWLRKKKQVGAPSLFVGLQLLSFQPACLPLLVVTLVMGVVVLHSWQGLKDWL